MKSKKAIGITAVFATVAVAAVALSACRPSMPSDTPPEPDDGKDKPVYTVPTFLKTDGELVKNEKGETVFLRGVNAGGLFVTEHWMTGFLYTTPSGDYRSLTQTFISRFGEDKTKALWEEYRNNWWSEQDFKACADMGVNCIRLPFTYMNVDFSAVTDYADAGKNYDFTALDAFVDKAAEYGIYTILDLHGAYGSHNGQDHSGQVIGNVADVTFYSDPQMIQLTVDLWSALSEHYKDNPAVAGYDLLNEPGEKAGLTSERHFAVYDRLYDAVRATGDEHIVIMESCWDGKDLPSPQRYGWENCMYSFHHYAGDKLSYVDHGLDWQKKISGITSQNFGVPLQMGEFTNYTSADKWEYILDLLNRSDFHWTSWTYKVWGNMPWGIVNIRGANDRKVDAMTDEYETIVEKFKILRSDSSVARKYAFYTTDENGEHVEYKTLERIFKEHTGTPSRGELPASGSYTLYNDDGWLGTVKSDSDNVVSLISDVNQARPIRLIYRTTENDGSAYLTVGGNYLRVKQSGDGYSVVVGGTTASADALFYPVVTDDGLAFVSYAACKYLRVDENGALRADALLRDDATKFMA